MPVQSTTRLKFDLITGGTPGLVNDARIVETALRSVYPVRTHVSRQRNLHLPFRRWGISLAKMLGGTRRIGLFFENIPPHWLSVVDQAVLIPNQEWVRPGLLQSLDRCTELWCKTRYAECLFQRRGFNTRYIGFTSVDRLIPDYQKDFNLFLHVAGRSSLKGTATVLRLWAQHPEWPTLTIVGRDNALRRHARPNMNIITSFLSNRRLSELMNRAGVHLCPSEAEGFGHYIAEAMSTKSIVITTDAPPMNELVAAGYGTLVGFDATLPQGFGERFLVDATKLEAAIADVLAAPKQRKAEWGAAARGAYCEQSAAFSGRLQAASASLACIS